MNIHEPLKAKLLIPPVRRDLVGRPRLFARLDESLSRRLALVSAPAGYGKTTLLSAWARQLDLPVAWLSLDEGDNDPARFLAHFCASIDGIEPDLSVSLLALAQADRFSGLGTGGSIEGIQTELLNRLQSISRPFVLVLDDFHLISAQPVHRLVAFLVDNLSPQMHVVIASRADPPLPLARLRARGDLVEVRQSDLRFTSDEAIALLNQVMGLGLEAGDVSALTSRTEGWIAGLRLAATSIQSRADVHRFIQEFKGSNRYVLDYLVEEVLQRQSQEVQAFLLRTSILNRLSGALCDAVVSGVGERLNSSPPHPVSHSPTQSSSGQEMLEYLERDNLFIVPLDDERKWYRYHRLFADLLQKRLGEAHPGLVPALHRRASVWYEQNGLLTEAIDHALAAEDFGRAAQLIERVAEETLMRSEVATLLKWIDALPDAEVRGRPSLSLYYAWLLLLRGAPLDAVEMRLARVEEHSSTLTLPLRAWVAHYRGDLEAAVEFSRRALERLPEDEAFLRGLAALSLAGVYHARGDTAASQRVLEDAALGSYQAGNISAAVYAAYYQAERCRREGDLRQARSLFLRALDLATDRSGNRLPIASLVFIGLGEIAREWDELETATRCVLEGIELAAGWTQLAALEAYPVLARVRQAQGDWAGVHEALQAMRQVATGLKASVLGDRAADMTEAWMEIMRGDLLSSERASSIQSARSLEVPRHWAERYGLSGEIDPRVLENDPDVGIRRLHKYEYPVVARLRIAEGRPTEALTLLESALSIVEKLNRVGLAIEYRTLIALAAHAAGQDKMAMQSLERALTLAESRGYLRIFLDEGKPLATLLREAASRRIRPEYVGRLLAAFPIPQPPFLAAQRLSERELEVLRLIAEGLSNEEIAQRLVVSLPTVKFHTSNIYGKLVVRSRTEAAAKARGLGLLPLV